MDTIYFFNKNNILKIIEVPDIYFTSEYGEACENSDNAEWECCIYKDLIYTYLKRPYSFEKDIYYDLITPYGYAGFYYKNKTTFDKFLLLFREEAKKRNYITEVVRQNPYINIELESYDFIVKKTTLGINIEKYKTFDDYLNDTSRDNKRGFKIAVKNNLLFEMCELNSENLKDFLKIYNDTMENLQASKYYFFNDKYFDNLINFKNNIFLASIKKDNLIIASCIIFKYKKYLHYHIGGSLLEYRNLRPNNFLHCNVTKYGIENKFSMYHLGGGLKDNDSLYEFKNKIGDISFNYNIYKNVLNKDVYNRIVSISPEDDGHFPIHR
jgi:serine/alanine adding enzyme